MTNNNVKITNCNGRFWEGMTLKEAQLNGVDKCKFRRDFYNLDKNRDGILSVNEVMNERERDAKIEKFSAIGFGTIGLMDYFTGGGKGKRAFWLGVDALCAVMSWYSYNKINNETQKYKEILSNQNNITIDKKA